MSLPREYSLANGTVYKLKRSINGLRQAPRACNKCLTDDLKLSGFQPLINAESVFSSVVDESVVYLIIYVDDILVVAASESELTRVKTILTKLYEIKDLWRLPTSMVLGSSGEELCGDWTGLPCGLLARQ
jgi:Reverse transcriptase (RNA-dependent DNA polymerase)